MKRIQVQVSHQTHAENRLRDFRVIEPVIIITHIAENNMPDARVYVAKAAWHATSVIDYTEDKPELGAAVFVTVLGPVKFQRTKDSEWETMDL